MVLTRGSAYICLYSRCAAPLFPDPDALDRHQKQEHFRSSISSPMWGSSYGTSMTPSSHPHTTATQGHLAVDYTTPSQSAAPSNMPLHPSADKHRCPYPSCDVSTNRQQDLERHMKKHETGVKDFDCPMRDCDRRGIRGFARKDKLNDHLKAKHKMMPM